MATAVSTPAELTVAMDAFRLTQLKLPATTLPDTSRASADSDAVAPSDVSVSLRGDTTVCAMVPLAIVAEIVSGEPVRPVDDAEIVCVPDEPRVHVVDARPLASVVALGVPSVPPPLVTANVTGVPGTGLP